MRPLLLISFFLIGIASPRLGYSQDKVFTLPAEALDTVLVIKPESFILYTEKGKYTHDPETSMFTTANVLKAFDIYFPKRIHVVTLDLDTAMRRKVNRALNQISSKIEYTRKGFKTNGYDPILDSLMRAHRCPYLLTLSHSGVTRTRKTHSNEVATSVALRVLSGGMFGSTVSSKSSSMSCKIFSQKEKGLVFYSASSKIDQDPAEAETTDRQFRQLIEGYLIPKKK